MSISALYGNREISSSTGSQESVRIGKASCHKRASFIHGPACALPPNTQGGSPVRKLRPPGSVRGVRCEAHSYRDALGLAQGRLR